MAHREDREQTRHKTVPTSADYLKEPLDHLFTSLDDESQSQSKTLDLIQVYTVLSDRLKRFITSCDATKRLDASGLDYLQDHAGELVRCLLRDVGLAFVDPPPLDAFRRHNQGKAAPSAGPAMDAQMKQPKRVAAICHHAIQLTSCIFAFPALSSVFSSPDLHRLLDLVLEVLRADVLPTFNAPKTRGLSMWCLSTQLLTAKVLQDVKGKLVGVMMTTLAGGESAEHIVGDCLKAIHNILVNHPALFFHDASLLCRFVLPHLVSSSRLLRLRAAYALTGFAHAALWSHDAGTDGTARSVLRDVVVRFAKPQSARSKPQDQPARQTLRDLITAAIPISKHTPCGADVSWAFSVLGCLTVLADGHFFASPHLLKLVVAALPGVRGHPWKPLGPLHSLVWRCLVWAYARTASLNEYPATKDPEDDPKESFRAKVFEIVRQDGTHGARSALVYALLGGETVHASPRSGEAAPNGSNVRKAILVVRDLIMSSSKSLHAEGTALLKQLTSAVVVAASDRPATYDPQRILPRSLLSGALVDVQPDRVHRVLRTMETFDISSVRPLTDTEVESHRDDLVSVWELAMKRAVEETGGLSPESDLLMVWKALLLVKTQLQQVHDHLNPSPDFLTRAITIVKGFITTSSPEGRGVPTRLKVAQILWQVMWPVLSDFRISEASRELFKATCTHLKRDGLEETRVTAEQLCVDLLVYGSLVGLSATETPLVDEDVSRRLWNLVAERWTSVEPARDWTDGPILLAIPLKQWKMSEEECSTWTTVLNHTISIAKASATSSDAVLEAIATTLSPTPIPPDVLPIFINNLSLDDEHHIPRTTLKSINDFLRIYPAKDIYPSLHAIDILSARLSSSPVSIVVPALVLLSEGLSTWIEAQKEEVGDTDYEKVIVNFYLMALDRLYDVARPSSQLFSDLENFLCSIFAHCRPPDCAFALKDFCDHVWEKEKNSRFYFPEQLKKCLCALCEVCPGIERSEYIPSSSQFESQSQSQPLIGEIVPDSQPAEDEIVDTSFLGEVSLSLPAITVTAGARAALQAHVAEPALEQRQHASDAQRPPLSSSTRTNEHSRQDQTGGTEYKFTPTPARLKRHPSLLENLNLGTSAVLGKRSNRADSEDSVAAKRRCSSSSTSRSHPHHSPNMEQRVPAPPREEGHHSPSNDESAPAQPAVPERWQFDGIELPSRSTPRQASIEAAPPEQTSLPSPPYSMEVPHPGSSSPEIGIDLGDLGYPSDDIEEDGDHSQTTDHTHEADNAGTSQFQDERKSLHTSRSLSLHFIEEAVDALVEDTDMPVDDVLAAQELLQEAHGVLVARLRARLAGRM